VEPTPAEAAFVFFIRCAGARRDEELLEYVYVLLRADVLKLLRGMGDAGAQTTCDPDRGWGTLVHRQLAILIGWCHLIG
jgi:hypothetical protein